MERTNFGKYIAILQAQHNQRQVDMARVLSVSPAFLSRVETGSAKPPEGWADSLSENYGLSSEETEKLRQIIQIERGKTSIIKNLAIDDQNLVLLLASKISSMTSIQKEKIKKLISESGN